MARAYFVTGTDTGVGKTWVSLAMLRYFSLRGESVVGMKPVAAGCDRIAGQLRNSDALLLQQHSSVALAYGQINPYAYAAPVSPHIAGVHDPVVLAEVLRQYQRLQGLANIIVVEGAGGWYSPLSATLDNADLAKALGIPVILVVAIRLGCINQARLSLQAIQQAGMACAGWVVVCSEPGMAVIPENIDFLVKALAVPLIGVMPYLDSLDVEALAASLTNLSSQ